MSSASCVSSKSGSPSISSKNDISRSISSAASQQTPLPPAPRRLLSRINAALQQIGEATARFADAQIVSFDLGGYADDAAGFDMETEAKIAPHEERLQAALKAAPADGDGSINLTAKDLPAVSVGKASTMRAAAFLGTLLRFASRHGAAVAETDHGLCLMMEEEVFSIRIHEFRRKRMAPRGQSRPACHTHAPATRASARSHLRLSRFSRLNPRAFSV